MCHRLLPIDRYNRYQSNQIYWFLSIYRLINRYQFLSIKYSRLFKTIETFCFDPVKITPREKRRHAVGREKNEELQTKPKLLTESIFPRPSTLDKKIDSFWPFTADWFWSVKFVSPVFSLVWDLLFDCSRVLEYAKIWTVLQSIFFTAVSREELDSVGNTRLSLMPKCCLFQWIFFSDG